MLVGRDTWQKKDPVQRCGLAATTPSIRAAGPRPLARVGRGRKTKNQDVALDDSLFMILYLSNGSATVGLRRARSLICFS